MAFSYQYDLVVCAIFQDEARFLAEWIEFHEKQGIQHFYLFDNLSKDNPELILDPYIKSGLVDLIHWPYQYNTPKEWNAIQCNAYFICSQSIKKRAKWCAFIDTDEFIFCPDGSKLIDKLRLYDSFSAVVINWTFYGTSHISKIPKGEKMLDHLVWRAKDDFHGNSSIKTIAKPIMIKDCQNPHYFTYLNGYAVNEAFERINDYKSPSNTRSIFRMHHYWTRDEDFFFNVKIPRRMRWNNDVKDLIDSIMPLNEVYDPILKS